MNETNQPEIEEKMLKVKIVHCHGACTSVNYTYQTLGEYETKKLAIKEAAEYEKNNLSKICPAYNFIVLIEG